MAPAPASRAPAPDLRASARATSCFGAGHLGFGAGLARFGHVRRRPARTPAIGPRPQGVGPAAPAARRDHQSGGDQHGQPSQVSPSHPAQERRSAAHSPPIHLGVRHADPLLAPVNPAASTRAAAMVPRPMAGPYDLMLLLDPTAPDDRREALIAEVESLIGSGGEVLECYDWGQRRLAFEIDHRPEAEYRLYQFQGDNALLDRLGQRLKIMDGVLRFRIIKIRPGQPTPPPPDQQIARRREERDVQDTRVAARAAADAPSA